MGEKNPGGDNKYEEEELANTPSALPSFAAIRISKNYVKGL